MFFGQYAIQINNNKALTFPEHLENGLAGNVFITQGFDRNLVIMPEDAFREQYKRATSINMADPLARLFLRLFLGNAVLVQLNKYRQMQLPERLCDYAELSNEDTAVLVGQGDHVEVWSKSYWDEQNIDLQDAKANANRFASLDLRL